MKNLFISVYNKKSLIKDDLSRRCGQKGERDYGDVSPVPLGAKESHDPPTVKFGNWLRAESLLSIND